MSFLSGIIESVVVVIVFISFYDYDTCYSI